MNKLASIFAAFATTITAFAADNSELMGRSNDLTQAQSNTKLQLNGVAQVRYTYGTGDSDRYGFEVPMVRLDVHGDLGNGISYRVSPRANGDGDFTLNDAFVAYSFDGLKDVAFKFGQFRPQFANEMNANDEDVLGATHTVVATTLGQTYTQGIEAVWTLGDLKLAAAFTDGTDRANTVVDASTNYGVTAKASYELFDGFTVGAGINHEDEFDVYTADATWTVGKFATTAAYFYSESDGAFSNAATATVAFNCTDAIQPFVAGEWGEVDGGEDLAIVTGGVNYYMAGTAVKWTNQVGYAFNSVDAAWDTTDTGWAATTDDGEVVAISQLQVRF